MTYEELKVIVDAPVQVSYHRNRQRGKEDVSNG